MDMNFHKGSLGRLVKVTFNSVKHSMAQAGEDTTTALQELCRMQQELSPWRDEAA
jgi:hypothetical protein